jgi:hypothetical protein
MTARDPEIENVGAPINHHVQFGLGVRGLSTELSNQVGPATQVSGVLIKLAALRHRGHDLVVSPPNLSRPIDLRPQRLTGETVIRSTEIPDRQAKAFDSSRSIEFYATQELYCLFH